jgi:hypothetical protein
MQLLRLHGQAAVIHRDIAAFEQQQSGSNLIPWRGQGDNLIDVHDCRSALDVLPCAAPVQRNEEDMEMEVLLNFGMSLDMNRLCLQS